jgi:hypothetical protein
LIWRIEIIKPITPAEMSHDIPDWNESNGFEPYFEFEKKGK